MTRAARSLALLAVVYLGCGGAGDEAPESSIRSSTRKQALASPLGTCDSALQPKLLALRSEDTTGPAVNLEGKDLNCGETYELVISRPDGTSTSEALTADPQGKVHSSYALDSQQGEHHARLHDSSGEEVAHTLLYSPVLRYGHLSWRPVGPRTAEFSVINVFRRMYRGSGPDGLAITGDTFLEDTGRTRLCFGDFSCIGTLRYEVLSYDAAQGWLRARAINSGQPQKLPGTGITVVETEPNDTHGTANLMQVGDDYFSTIGTASESDYVRFTLSQSTRLELRTVLQTLSDSYLYLYDGAGGLLASDDDSGGGYSSLISTTLGAGTYYIRAAAFGSATGRQTVQLRQVVTPPAGPLTRTYASDGPFTASITGCCRINTVNNSDSDYRLQTEVRFGVSNSSPVSSLPPIVDAPANTPGFTFQIPATDAEGDQLTFRLATNSESSLWSQPPGLGVSSSGLLSWSTVGRTPGQLWAAQVVIEERRNGVRIGSSAVEFLLRVTSAPSGSAPTCLPPPQTSYLVPVGQPVQFTVGTRDLDAGDVLTLAASGLPSGASMLPALPLQGPSGISSTFTWTPSASAAGNTYPVGFRVTDSTGQQGQCTVNITVPAPPTNQPPVANAGPAQDVSEGARVTLDGSASSAPEGQALTYQWHVLSSTGPEVTLSSTTSPTPSFTPSDDGTYTFLLTVTDSQGASSSATVVVRVLGVAPQVSALGGELDEGQVFTSSGSFTDPGADSWSARVNYGDGSPWEPLALDNGTFSLSHSYADNPSGFSPGDFFQVEILITDDDGAEGRLVVPVAVRNVAPAIVNAPDSLFVQEHQPLSASITFTDPGTDSWQVGVDYGDGTTESLMLESRELVLAHSYASPGSYTISLTLMDDDGGQATLSIPVEVQNVAPIVHVEQLFGQQEGGFSSLYVFWDDLASGAESFMVTVDYGDGTGPQPLEDYPYPGFYLEHLYADSGTYLVTVTVTDNFGGMGTATVPLVVANVAPWVDQLQWGSSVEGSPTVLGGYIHDPGQDTWTVEVDYGDGTGIEALEFTTHMFELNHTFARGGLYRMTFNVLDDEGGGVGSFEQWIWVEKVAPEVSLPESGELIEGSTFRASGSFTDPGLDTWTAEVDYGDGTDPQPLVLHGKTFELEHFYANSAPGSSYRVTVAVKDSTEQWSWRQMVVTVHNVAPELSFTGGEGLEGSPVVFSGSFSDPGVEQFWGMEVDYGDGERHWQSFYATGSFTLEHTYLANGVYTVTVRLWDDESTSTVTTQVVVHNVAPVVTAEGGTTDEGSDIYLLASFSDPGLGGWAVTIDYGDGSEVMTWFHSYQGGLGLYHRYADAGTYLVTVTVMDNDGGVGSTTVPVVVRNVVPILTEYWDGDEKHEGGAYRAYGSASQTSQDTWTVTVDYGDGSAPEEVSPSYVGDYYGIFALSHVYDDNGLYTLTLTLTDDDGGSVTHAVAVEVLNVAPTVTAANDSPRYWGMPISLVGTATDPSQADTLAGFTSLWTLGDGTTASGLATAHAYAAPGTYLAQLSVEDKDGGPGGTGLASTPVTVQARPAALTCENTATVFGFPTALNARFMDGLPGGLLGGRRLTFRIGDSAALGPVTTDALGLAGVQSQGELVPGNYTITVSFAGDSHYEAAEAHCMITVIQSDGKITGGGLRFANRSRGGFNVKFTDGSDPKGELQFHSDTTSFHAHTMTVLGVSDDKRQGWFTGLGTDGRAFTAYVEDNGEPGSADVFTLWIDNVLQTGDGPLSGGNIQIH
jgi:PKD repeat protein